jgi:hypothetical protein
MEYGEEKSFSIDELLCALNCNDAILDRNAMLSCSNNKSSYLYAIKLVNKCFYSENEENIALAVLCIGHIVRVYGNFPIDDAIRILGSASKKESVAVRANIEEALDDISIFSPTLYSRIISELKDVKKR